MVTEYDKGLEWSRSSFKSVLYKSHAWQDAWWVLLIIAAFTDVSRLKDDSFDGDGEHSDVYVELTSCSKELPLKFAWHAFEERRNAFAFVITNL